MLNQVLGCGGNAGDMAPSGYQVPGDWSTRPLQILYHKSSDNLTRLHLSSEISKNNTKNLLAMIKKGGGERYNL